MNKSFWNVFVSACFEHGIAAVPSTGSTFAKVMILALVWLAGCDNQNWHEREIAESKTIGDLIFGALEGYRAKVGKYPNQLSELVPEFLSEIKPPTAGTKKWIYRVSPERTFCSITFTESATHPRNYGRSAGQPGWSYDSGSF
jgi:hypothetical protein